MGLSSIEIRAMYVCGYLELLFCKVVFRVLWVFAISARLMVVETPRCFRNSSVLREDELERNVHELLCY